ncbi:MAG: hypothetical protein ACRDPY_38805 [Streptosporangiaceae bacterium]
MSPVTGPAQEVAASQPGRFAGLTLAELRDREKEAKGVIAFFDRQDPVPPARADMQATLEEVRAEMASREAG